MKKFKELLKDEEKRMLILLIVSGIALIGSFFGVKILSVDLAYVAVILCGIPIIKEAAEGLIIRLDIKADVLVSLALIASLAIGEVFAAGEVAFIMMLGSLMEEHTVSKAKAGIEKLVDLTPTIARRVIENNESIINASDVKIDDIIRVLPGETIPVDGIIIDGITAVDQSIMTGESMPVDKSKGDSVFSGTVNQFGKFDMKAVKAGEDSSLQKMIKLVKSADAGKSKIVNMADKWATWIVLIAVTAAIGTWIVTGEIVRAVTILVVFCPCSLILATPTAIVAGIGNLTKCGILVKEGDALERLAGVTKMTFDKTGTLTYGKPTVTEIVSFDEAMSKQEVLKLISNIERFSEHPLGKAIVDHFNSVYDENLEDVSEFKMIIGRGVCGKINDQNIIAGNKKMLYENEIALPKTLEEKADEVIQKGSTVVFLAVNNEIKGFIALEDILREDVKNIIKDIEDSNVECILITGDNKHTAENIGKNAAIDKVYYECLPEDKLSIIDNLQKSGHRNVMIGDGINDAPALKKSFIGIAMGGIGSDIAIEAADIVLIHDNIKNIPHLLRLSKKIMKTIKINLTLSMMLNFVAIILAMTGILNPIIGALVHNAGSVTVIIHSSLLLTWKSEHTL